MSSIYRKGRDGYYYYQTYIYNPDSDKKDKKIFHSLNTKNKSDAEEKKKKLDQQYYKKNHPPPQKNYFNLYTFNLKQFIFVFFSTIILTSYSFYYFDLVIIPEDSQTSSDTLRLFAPESFIENKIGISELHSKRDDLILGNPDNIVPLKLKKESELQKIDSNKLKYYVERVESDNGAFRSGKIFVIVDEKYNKIEQRLVCEKVALKYPQFSNIIICIYSDNIIGRTLASGNFYNFSIEEQSKCWLAMYSYNDVEGEYFDSNPSSYLIRKSG